MFLVLELLDRKLGESFIDKLIGLFVIGKDKLLDLIEMVLDWLFDVLKFLLIVPLIPFGYLYTYITDRKSVV